MAEPSLLVVRSPTLNDFFKEEHPEAFINFLVGIESGTSIRAEYVLPFLNAEQLHKFQAKENYLSYEAAYLTKIESVLPGGLRLIGIVANESAENVVVNNIVKKLAEVNPVSSLVSSTLIKVIILDSENVKVTTSNDRDIMLGEGFDPKAPAIKQFKAVTASYVIDAGAIVSSTRLRDTMEELNKFKFHIDEEKSKVYVLSGSDGVVEQKKADSKDVRKYIRYNGRVVVREYPFMDDEFKHQCIRESVARALTAVQPGTSSFQVDTVSSRFLPPLVFYGTPNTDVAEKSVEQRLFDIVPTISGNVKIRNLNEGTTIKADFTNRLVKPETKNQLPQTIAMAVFIAVAAIITGYFLLRN
uniref:VWFA domain-containing protein n=1 Tax=Panagrellus redivivus TaxID=6233 RepID=A0A7E4VR21_PANRE